jgi:hypothetical protein
MVMIKINDRIELGYIILDYFYEFGNFVNVDHADDDVDMIPYRHIRVGTRRVERPIYVSIRVTIELEEIA